MEVVEVREAAHAFNCTYGVAAGDRVFVIVAEIVLDQGRLAYVQFHVAIILGHEHLVELRWVLWKAVLAQVQARDVAALFALIVLGLRVIHVGLGRLAGWLLLGVSLGLVVLGLLLLIVLIVVLTVRVILLVVASAKGSRGTALTDCNRNSLRKSAKERDLPSLLY